MALEKRVMRIAVPHQSQDGIPWTCRLDHSEAMAVLEDEHVVEVVDEQLALAMAALDIRDP